MKVAVLFCLPREALHGVLTYSWSFIPANRVSVNAVNSIWGVGGADCFLVSSGKSCTPFPELPCCAILLLGAVWPHGHCSHPQLQRLLEFWELLFWRCYMKYNVLWTPWNWQLCPVLSASPVVSKMPFWALVGVAEYNHKAPIETLGYKILQTKIAVVLSSKWNLNNLIGQYSGFCQRTYFLSCFMYWRFVYGLWILWKCPGGTYDSLIVALRGMHPK